MVIIKIPKNITFICKIDKSNKSNIMDTFPVDSSSDKTTALEWVRGHKHKQFTFPNKNFDNLIITNLEQRGEGGRAYKVVLNNKFRFDLRENVLMDIIKHQGIGKNGLLIGPFKFVQVGSQTKLMFTDGDLFKDATQRDKERTQIKKIPDNELTIGGIYQSLNGSTSIYLGKGFKLQYEQNNSYLDKSFTITKVKKSPKQMIWYKPHFSTDLSADNIKEYFKESTSKIGFGNNSNFIMSSTQSNIKLLGHINTSISSIRTKQFNHLLNFKKKITTNANMFNNYDSGTHVYYSQIFAFLGAFLFFQDNEPTSIPTKIFEKAESLFKHCIDLSKLKPWTN